MVLEGNRIAMIVFMILLGLLGLAAPPAAAVAGQGGALPVQTQVNSARRARYLRVPMGFERNEGQTDRRVKYLARGAGYEVFLTGDEAVLRLEEGKGKGEVVRLKLQGAKEGVEVKGEGEMAGKANYFIGRDARKWRRDVALYREVRYEGVYPGVDLVYYGNGEELEYDFRVGAGGEVKGIRLRVGGARKVEVKGGELVMEGEGGGEVRFERPEAYQEEGGKKRSVEVRYAVKGKEVGFEVGAYDRSRELVIDPVLRYATYLGGTGGDVGYGIAVDSLGYAYITGSTNSISFPTKGPEQSGNGGSGDAFIVKLSTDGSSLVYSTFLGGTGSDTGYAIAISAGDAFVTGTTSSADFPVTQATTTSKGAFQTTYGGNGDAFVTQLNSTGDGLVYSSYLGGQGADFGLGIAVDGSANAYVTGWTQSNDFPTPNGLYSSRDGVQDAFVAKVNFDGSALLYSTYLGGSGVDAGQAIKVDSSGNAYIAGYTFSVDFKMQSAYLSKNAGAPTAADAFVTKLNSSGSALTFSTYLGGTGDDRAFGIALDSSNNVYVVGATQSTDFPTSTTSAPYQGQNNGKSDAFVAKLNSSGSTLAYSTYLGGSEVDQANGIAVDSSGNAFVIGFTQSSDFPTLSPVQSLLGGSGGGSCGTTLCADAFVAQVNSNGTALNYSTYLGGNGADFGWGIALGPSSIPYMTGYTASTNFPAIAGAYQGSLAGGAGNVFVAKLAPNDLPNIAIIPQKIYFGSQTVNVRSSVQTVTIINAGTATLNIQGIIMAPVSSTTGVTTATDFSVDTGNCIGNLVAGGASCTLNVAFTPSATGSETGQISITDNAANSPQTITLTGDGVSVATQVTVTPTSLPFGNEPVGSITAPQKVTITNTGTATLTISKITANGDYLQTNTCEALLNVLNVGQSCIVSVSFQPTATGARNGTLTIADDASGSPQKVSLSGTGVAVFTLASSPATSTILVGSATASFPVKASAPSNFAGNITLACPTNLTCAFSPASILPGQTSTLTVSNLTAALTSPYNFTVIGTSGSQTTTVALTILMADYSLSVSPALNTIVSGAPAGYSLTLTPSNGFNKAVQFSCTNLPNAATCSFTPSTATPSGGPVTVRMTVSTIKSSSSGFGPLGPFKSLPSPLACLAGLAVLMLAFEFWKRRRVVCAGGATPRHLLPSLVGVLVVIALLAGMSACRPGAGSTSGGTPTGGYTITVTGTLNSNAAVTRTITFNLEVT
jgi:Beta-propeller repeat/HYDIN/CFA65/VesB-like, Ig-like domain